MATLPVSFRASPLPAQGKWTPQQFLDAIVSRLSLDTDTTLCLFNVGATAPTYNAGPWLKDGITWYVWDDVTAAYVPEVIESPSLKYIASATAPDNNVYTFWIELNGAGKAIAIKYYSGGAWKDVYEDKFALYSTTVQMNAAIAAAFTTATKKYPASAQLTADQTIAIDTTYHKVLFNSEVIDPNSAYDAANSKYVCPVNGIYRVTANLQVNNNGGAAAAMELGITVAKNGVIAGPAAPISGAAVASPPGSRWYPQVGGYINALAGNELEVFLTASDGVNAANVDVAAQSQFFIELVQAT